MTISVVYCTVTNGRKTLDHAARFAASWNQFPPGESCELLVGCNGGPPSSDLGVLFSGLGAKFFPRINDPGFDISLYIDAAKGPCADSDMMLCLGESVHFWREGWLKRLVEATEKFGKGLHGIFATHVLRAHLLTTAFFCAPKFLREYPLKIKDRASRLEFEHGERALWRLLYARKVPVKLVTWDGVWNPGEWRVPRNGLWNGDQKNLLFFCNHSQRYAEADEKRKRSWAKSADRAYR